LNFGNYIVSGYPGTTDSSSFSIGSSNPPGETLLLNIFSGVTQDSPESNESAGTLASPAGTPSLTAETPLSNNYGLLAADVSVPTSGGTYSTSISGFCATKPTPTGCIWYGWQVSTPEE
jgi:hypothetical protein